MKPVQSVLPLHIMAQFGIWTTLHTRFTFSSELLSTTQFSNFERDLGYSRILRAKIWCCQTGALMWQIKNMWCFKMWLLLEFLKKWKPNQLFWKTGLVIFFIYLKTFVRMLDFYKPQNLKTSKYCKTKLFVYFSAVCLFKSVVCLFISCLFT